ncbi:hypothetical protein [Roseomonas marmotae]|uniref:Uncharacterized protein n=1 Tax=Roseomonas marmotae TaxID=2768161 RepID=A0ABS3KHD4_9PROT|nr:hypothetical protein [Roseomonas marmotae]MBO1076355.1 hypothetical protein [Roseomonas marmotae]QTI80586.1 hypothetical protein IAI58_07620 [Roseomonas marmotae]
MMQEKQGPAALDDAALEHVTGGTAGGNHWIDADGTEHRDVLAPIQVVSGNPPPEDDGFGLVPVAASPQAGTNTTTLSVPTSPPEPTGSSVILPLPELPTGSRITTLSEDEVQALRDALNRREPPSPHVGGETS